ncbi:MAG: hypothetical protein KDD94_12060, partial [Calditrichaeota bacterium]|nr:hypothetical protein [Calditrichota bacterium]
DNNGLAIAFSFDLKTFSSIGPEGGFLDAETEELIIWDKDHSLGYVTISPQYQKTDTTGFAYFIGANISMNVLSDIDIYAPGRHLLVDVSEDTRFFRISAQVGINYRTDNFVLSLAYERGFSSVFTSSANRSGAKLNSINLNVAYRYNIRF